MGGLGLGFVLGLALATSTAACTAPGPSASETQSPHSAPLEYTGINFWAGAAHDDKPRGANYMHDYGYDTPSIAYFTGKGMNVIRLAFLWERVQTTTMAPLDEVELQRIDDFVKAANEKGASVILDVQNFARYQQSESDPLPTPTPIPDVVGSLALPSAAFADLWSKLATHFAGNQQVIFGLMNEPHDMPTMQWIGAANAALASIRATGARNLVLVPGSNWSLGYRWSVAGEGATDGVANSVGLMEIEDPGDNYMIEVHQYFHDEESPDKNSCVSGTAGSEALTEVTGWLNDNGARAFLGEIGTGSGDVCLAALDDALSYIESNRDVWAGWAYFSGGQGLEDQDMTIQPGADGADKPQMEVLLRHMAPPSFGL